MILNSSLNSKKCWVALLSKLQDLVESFASFSNSSFQSNDSLRRKIFTYTAYSYEYLLNVFAHLKNPIYCSISIYKTCWRITCWRITCLRFSMFWLHCSLVTSFDIFTCCQVKESFMTHQLKQLIIMQMLLNRFHKFEVPIINLMFIFLIVILLLFSGFSNVIFTRSIYSDLYSISDQILIPMWIQ